MNITAWLETRLTILWAVMITFFQHAALFFAKRSSFYGLVSQFKKMVEHDSRIDQADELNRLR